MSGRKMHFRFIMSISLLLIILFVYTGISKLLHLDTFITRLEQMPYISPFAQLIGWCVPLCELVLAGLLLTHKYRLIGLYLSFILLTLFSGYIITVLQFSSSIPCSCGGIVSFLGWRDHILLNIGFMVLVLLGIIWCKKEKKDHLDKHTT